MAALGMSLAPDDYPLDPSPTWERIDTTYNVTGWTISRGRPNETGRVGAGTATIRLVDTTGDFDPTNTSGDFYGRLVAGQPLARGVQAAIALQNPTDDTWATLFRGFVDDVIWDPYATFGFANVTLELVDAIGFLAEYEMPLDGSFGDDVVDGNIVFDADTATDAVQTRINAVLDSIGWDAALRNIFTGNVKLQEAVYSPRELALTVMQDAADAEFPDVATLYAAGPRNPGVITFHGRLARFDYSNPLYDIQTWELGDDTASTADPTNVVRISPPLQASVEGATIYTSALSTPQSVAAGDIAGQYVTDATNAAYFGLKTWSAENLLTAGGASLATALQVSKLFADYRRDNYSTPRVRVGEITIRPQSPTGVHGDATWAFMCGVELNDVVHLTTTHTGGGGFDHDFFVEGIRYEAKPMNADHHDVTLTLDVSPVGYFDNDPFT
jgi:hypothetical protein